MPLIVEDGSIVPSANSYVSLAESDAYFLTYGNFDWAGSDEDKEQALVNATRAVELMYGPRYLSYPLSMNQGLLFPRYTFRDKLLRYHPSNTIPQALKDAVCEVALKSLNFEDILPEVDERQYTKRKSVQVDVLKQDIEYLGTPLVASRPGFSKVEMLLTPLLATEQGRVRLGA